LSHLSLPFSSEEYRCFCRFLEESCGIVLGENKQYLVATRLNRLMAELSLPSLGELLDRVRHHRLPGLRERVIEAMTTNETSWFRDDYPYDILKSVIFPGFVKAGKMPIRVWSAACSSGQEPYSIAMTALEYGLSPPIQILATDISASMLRDAKSGVYAAATTERGLSLERRQRFFSPMGTGQWQVTPDLRRQISFREFNLLQGYQSLGTFQLIFCRNVLIYFSLASKRDIISRMAQILSPGGWLFLGASESIVSYCADFDLIRYPTGGMVYRRR
jgi:chemotaxis protein methyltransferase CheR